MTAQVELEVLVCGPLTFTEKPGNRVVGDCSVCQTGIEVGEMFGLIPGETLLLEWAKQHAHNP